jgi:hypothetical protein
LIKSLFWGYVNIEDRDSLVFVFPELDWWFAGIFKLFTFPCFPSGAQAVGIDYATVLEESDSPESMYANGWRLEGSNSTAMNFGWSSTRMVGAEAGGLHGSFSRSSTFHLHSP